MAILKDNSILINGVTDTFGKGNQCENNACSDELLMLIKNDGGIEWARNIGTEYPEQPFGVYEFNNSIFATTVTYGTGSQSGDSILAKFNISGELDYSQIYGGDGFDSINGMIFSDDWIIFAGTTSSFETKGLYDLWIAKTFLDGTFDRDCLKEILISTPLDIGTPSVIINDTDSVILENQPNIINTNLPENSYDLLLEDLCIE